MKIREYIFFMIIGLQIITLLLFLVAHMLQAWFLQGTPFQEMVMMINGCFFNALIFQILTIFLLIYYEKGKETRHNNSE